MANRQILLIFSNLMAGFPNTASLPGDKRALITGKERFPLQLKRRKTTLLPLLFAASFFIFFKPSVAQETKQLPAEEVQLKKINISDNKNGVHSIALFFARGGDQPASVQADLQVVDERNPSLVLFRERRGIRIVPGDSLQNSIRINFKPKQAGYFKSIVKWTQSNKKDTAVRTAFFRHGLQKTKKVTECTPWRENGGDKERTKYSALNQVNTTNVKNLKPAWIYHTGDSEHNTSIQCTPIVIDGIMYITTAKAKVVALDAATGKELWKYDAFVNGPVHARTTEHGHWGQSRGVAYWSDAAGKKKRIIQATKDSRLISIDAVTGRPDPAFGSGGIVNLRDNPAWDFSNSTYAVTSAPAIFENLIILGFANDESAKGAPGDIRAFNVQTGKEEWRFRTIPQPGEFGNDTWEGMSWKERSGANAWGGISIDTKRGIAFAALGTAGFDFYGGDRKGDNLFANCVIALNARTGKRIWHYQLVHHDLWDLDLAAPPALVVVNHNGVQKEAVAQTSKMGFIYVFDRMTGEPLFEIKEKPVPSSDVPGEQTAKTQPFPVAPPPLVPQSISEDNITNISKEAHQYILDTLRKMKYGSMYTPPSLQGTVYAPGLHGGVPWTGGSFDSKTGIMYVAANNVPYVMKLVKAQPPYTPDYRVAAWGLLRDKEGYPGIKPPWGILSAVDLNKGTILWQSVLGVFPELVARGIPPTGTPNFGGSIVTDGGLVFVGGTMDAMFRAFDKANGEVLWEYQLDAAAYTTPATYSVNKKQYIVVAAGGGGQRYTKTGDAFVAFALSDDK
jgi:quinoprotein glucose dehydrogenase